MHPRVRLALDLMTRLSITYANLTKWESQVGTVPQGTLTEMVHWPNVRDK